MLSGLEGLLEIVGLEMMAEGIRAGTHLTRWRERVPASRSCSAETGRQTNCGQMEWRVDWFLTT